LQPSGRGWSHRKADRAVTERHQPPALFVRGQYMEAVGEPEVQQIEEYAKRVKRLCAGAKYPSVKAGTPEGVRRNRENRVAGAWLKRAKKVLEDDWHPIRRILPRGEPQVVQTLRELRQDALDKMKPRPMGGVEHLEPRNGRLRPDAELERAILLFADELSYEASEMKKAAPNGQPGQKPSGAQPVDETGTATDSAVEAVDKEKLCPHSDDFRTVNWFGSEYGFTSYQAACVKVWYQHWRAPARDVSDETVLEAAECVSKRVSDLFKRHPAWNDMIVQGATRGTHRLREPTEPKPPEQKRNRKRKRPNKK
jgi:hypothetical protein